MADHLTEAQLSELQESLRQRLTELRGLIREALLSYENQQYIDLAGRVHDPEEESLADLLVDLQLADIDRHVSEVRAIEAALQRMAQGSYGICVDTGEPIAFARLQVQPTALRSIQAQEAYERSHYNGPGGASL